MSASVRRLLAWSAATLAGAVFWGVVVFVVVTPLTDAGLAVVGFSLAAAVVVGTLVAMRLTVIRERKGRS